MSILTKNVKIVLSALFLPTMLFADGLGIYMLNVINEQSNYADTYNNKDYGYSPGIGLSYDSNLGQNSVFSYRLGFDYYEAKGTQSATTYDYNTGIETIKIYNISKSTFSMANTFCFGLYRSEHIRLWIGSQITAIKNDSSDLDDTFFNTIEIGPSVGVNYNINDNATLAMDATFNIIGEESSTKIRAYLFWRFDEKFKIRPKVKKRVRVKKTTKNREMGDKLIYLQQLKDEGILTEQEYETKRQQVIDAY